MNGNNHFDSAPAVRDTSDGPWCWQSKSALKAILEVCDGRAAALPLSVYLALTWIASDNQSSEFEVSINEIGSRAGCCYKSVANAFAVLDAAGVIHREEQRIPGSKLQKPSRYRLLTPNPLGIACRALGKQTGDATVPRSLEEDEEIREEDKKNPLGFEALSASNAEPVLDSSDAALFNAMAAVCGAIAEEITRSGRTQMRQALKEIAAVSRNVNAQEIRRRGENFASRFPKLSITPAALARYWASCGSAPDAERAQESIYTQIDR